MGVEIGQTISHYKILRKLGHGGMGYVCLAENTRLGRTVALRFLAPLLTCDPLRIKPLEDRAHAIAELSHPNVCRIYGIEQAEDYRFLVMEYVEGETLGERIARSLLPLREVNQIGIAVAEGLVHVHKCGLLHSDLKASNIMLSAESGIKIFDFGLTLLEIAMIQEKAHAEAWTWYEPSFPELLESESHMSPEQVSGKETDERADLWSLGAVLYHCLAGRLPFEGESTAVVFDRILSSSPPCPGRYRKETPLNLEFIVYECLKKDPKDRFQTAGDLLKELRGLVP